MVKKNKSLRMLKMLKVIKENSDSAHPLTQKEINLLLKNVDGEDFSINTENGVKALSQTIRRLINEYPNIIKYSKDKNGRISDIYYSPEFNADELEILAEGVMRMGLDDNATDSILEKLSVLFKFDKNNFIPIHTVRHEDVHPNTALIKNAIRLDKQISFEFKGYNHKGYLTQTVNKRTYIVNPYELVESENKIYLFANTPPYKNLSIYRVDLMTDIKIIDEKRLDKNKIKELWNADIEQLIAQHHGMMYGEPVTVTLKVRSDRYALVLDIFGSIKLLNSIDENHDLIEVVAAEKIVLDLAYTASDIVEIISPEYRQRVAEKARAIAEKYEQN